MLFYCPFEKKHAVAHALERLGAAPTSFGFAFEGLQTWQVPEAEANQNVASLAAPPASVQGTEERRLDPALAAAAVRAPIPPASGPA
jgi:hypothetical protein